jgi:putative glutamine amidotransferase
MSGHAMAVMVPAVPRTASCCAATWNWHDYAQALDGLVLQGGNDVCARQLRRVSAAARMGATAVRDEYEIALMQRLQ